MGIFKSSLSHLLLWTKQETMSLLYTKNKENDLLHMLAAKVHLGTQNCTKNMKPCVYKRNKDGIHYMDLNRTWEKVMLAARIVAAVQQKCKKDVLVVSNRPYAQRAILKFATYAGAEYLGGKWVPGTLTNQNTKKYLEPRLIIVCDPRSDHQAVKEASYMNIPVIALCDADSPLGFIDIAVPCNNKGRQSIALIFWLLARETLYLRGDRVQRGSEWDIMVDLFMFREITDKKKSTDDDDEDEDEAVEEAPEEALQNFRAGQVGEDEDDEEEEEAAWKPEGTADATADKE